MKRPTSPAVSNRARARQRSRARHNGSTDRTLEIARCSARVFHLAWQDDFRWSCNFALARPPGWILSIGSHESIRGERYTHESVEALTETTSGRGRGLAAPLPDIGNFIGWQPGLASTTKEGPTRIFEVECVRMFRNRPVACDRNRGHESISHRPSPSLSKPAGLGHPPLARLDDRDAHGETRTRRN